MTLPALPAAQSLTPAQVGEYGAQIVAWAETVDDIVEVREAVSKWAAITEYIRRTSKDGVAEAEAALRRLEVRVGVLLGPPRHAEPGVSPNVSTAPETLSKHERSEFRAMAENADVVEAVIAQSSDANPASRRQVLGAIKEKKKDTTEMTTREAIKTLAQLGLTAQQIADDIGLSHTRVCNIAREDGVALPGSQLAKEQRTSIIAELAASGHSSAQIGQRLGLSASYVRIEAKRLGIEIPADAIVGGNRKFDSARIVRASIESVDGIGILFDQIDYGQLDPEDVNGWLPILETSIRSLTTLRNNLRKVSQP